MGAWKTNYRVGNLYDITTFGTEKWHAFALYDSFSFLSSDMSIQVIKLSDASIVSELTINDMVMDMETKDSFLFGISSQKFWLFDISKPESIKVIFNDTNLKGKELVLKDSILFIGGYNQIYILNVKDPLNPFVYATLSPGGEGLSVNSQNVFYTRFGLRAVDISDLYNPVEISSYTDFPSREVSALYLYGSLALVGTSNGFWTVDISDPTKPFEIGKIFSVDFNYGQIHRIKVRDSVAFLAVETGIYSVDFSNPYSPFIVSSINRINTKDLVINDSFLYFTSGNKLFISKIQGNGNIIIIDSVSLSASLTTLKKWGNKLYSLLNISPFFDSFNLKIAVFDIFQPDSLVYLTTMEFASLNSLFYPEFGIYDSLLFLGDFRMYLPYKSPIGLLYVFNISNPLNPILIDTFANTLHLINEFIVNGDYLWIGGYRDTMDFWGVDSISFYAGFEVRNIKDSFKTVLIDSFKMPSFYSSNIIDFENPLHVFFVGDSVFLWKKGTINRDINPNYVSAGFQIYKFHLPLTGVKEKRFYAKENPIKIYLPFLTGGIIPFRIYLSEPKEISFSLFNISGRKVFESHSYKLKKGLSKGKIILPEDFPEGIYWIKIKGLKQKKLHKVIVLK